MSGRKYTWANTRDQPSMAKLDRFLLSNEWNAKFPNTKQKTLPNTSSDHCPVMIEAFTDFRKTKTFRFETFWLHMPEFKDMVKEEWQRHPTASTPAQMHTKLQQLQSTITTWEKSKVGNIRAQTKVCRQFIAWIEEVQEIRQPTNLEKNVKATIKLRFTQLAVLEEDLWRQRAKTKWELEGDKNTRYFHMYASRSKAANTIGGIERGGQIHRDQRTKAQVFRQFYIELMGTKQDEEYDINWDLLYPNRTDLSEMAAPISVEEISQAISSWPNNKAPGPDGYGGEFYKEFKDTLMPDIQQAS